MQTTPQPSSAWQPFTPGGVAAFARASLWRLLLAELLVALLVAGAVVWFVQTAWCPVISSAIARLPEQGELRGGQLEWPGVSAELLAENHFLAISLDLQHTGGARSPAHVQVEFGKRDIQLFSLFGFVRIGYGSAWTAPCNRPALTPWWGAWRPPLLALLALGTIAVLFLVWACLASLYCIPVWLVAFFANRELSLPGSWRLCSASLMSGAILMMGTIVLCRLGMLELIGLLIAAGAHLVIGWGYCLASLVRVGRHPSIEKCGKNPFTGSPGDLSNPRIIAPSSPSGSKPGAPK